MSKTTELSYFKIKWIWAIQYLGDWVTPFYNILLQEGMWYTVSQRNTDLYSTAVSTGSEEGGKKYGYLF